MWIAFLGAGAAGRWFFLGSLGRDGLTPIKIVLAGAAITALFVSFTQGLLVIDEQGLQSVLFWLAGSVSGRSIEMLVPVLPFILGVTVVAIFMGRSINILQSGDDIAKGLGQRTMLTKITLGIIIIILAGSSVAVAGSIGFIGLIVPHMAIQLVGTDYRWIIPYSAVLGAILLLLADIAARYVIMPLEMPIGVMTALIGAPFFIYIARKGLAKMPNYVSVRTKTNRISFQIAKRTAWIQLLLSLLLVLITVLGLSAGSEFIHPVTVVKELLGYGNGDYDFVLHTLRLPRVLMALLVGALRWELPV